MGQGAFAQRGQAVTAFQNRDDATLGVTLGQRDDRRGEIVIASGLALGDVVLRAPSGNLTDGAPLQRVAAGAGAASAVAAAAAASK